MEKRTIEKAIYVANSIQDLYRRVDCYRALDNPIKEQEYLEKLNKAFQLEKAIYKEVSYKDIKMYKKLLIQKNPCVFFANYSDILFGNMIYNPIFRVYNRLLYIERANNYYSEFHIEPIEEEKAYDYFSHKIIVQTLYFMLCHSATNPYQKNDFVFEKLKTQLAYYFKEIEDQYWNNEEPVLKYPTAQEYDFASCIDLLVYEEIDYFAVINFENYFIRMINMPIEKLKSLEFEKLKPIHEFYLRFLFFLMRNKELKENYIFLLEQYATLFPDIKDVYQNCLHAILEDSKIYGNKSISSSISK